MADLKTRLSAATNAGNSDAGALDAVMGIVAGKKRVAKTLPMPLLDPWSDPSNKGQPFRLLPREKLEDLKASMAENGLLSPILVREYGNGRYQILSGHNRVIAASELGWTEIDAIVFFGLSDKEAADIMVDTNLAQREYILPSERARAWKVKMDAMRHQGTSSHGGTKNRSDAELGQAEGKGRSTIQRYIRLTRLTDPILDIVDGYQWEKEEWVLKPSTPMIPLTVADILVDTDPEIQEVLYNMFHGGSLTRLNKAQAEALRSLSKGVLPADHVELTHEVYDCLHPEKPQNEKPFVLKLNAAAIPDSAKKYLSDDELLQQIQGVITQYVKGKEGKNHVCL